METLEKTVTVTAGGYTFAVKIVRETDTGACDEDMEDIVFWVEFANGERFEDCFLEVPTDRQLKDIASAMIEECEEDELAELTGWHRMETVPPDEVGHVDMYGGS